MRHSAKQHENMPNGMIMSPAVMHKEIGACGIKESLTNKHC